MTGRWLMAVRTETIVIADEIPNALIWTLPGMTLLSAKLYWVDIGHRLTPSSDSGQ